MLRGGGAAQMSCPLAPEVHRELLERYADGQPLSSVPDDGYILQVPQLHSAGSCHLGLQPYCVARQPMYGCLTLAQQLQGIVTRNGANSHRHVAWFTAKDCYVRFLYAEYRDHECDMIRWGAAQAVGHHCVAAGEIGLLEQLLQQPTWLHEKLRAYGVAALVLDFRRSAFACIGLAVTHSNVP